MQTLWASLVLSAWCPAPTMRQVPVCLLGQRQANWEKWPQLVPAWPSIALLCTDQQIIAAQFKGEQMTATKKPLANGTVRIPQESEYQGVTIERVKPKILQVKIVGITPLIVSAWSEKARRMMLEKQEKKSNRGRAARNPEEEYRDSLYVSHQGWTGIPAGGVKGCLVNACRAVDGMPMTLAKRILFVASQGTGVKDEKQLVRVYGEHKMHRGMVRLDSGVAMERFRAEYKEWYIDLEIHFLENLISAEQVANLVELAGYIEGLCEHRPGAPKSNTGDSGRFRIEGR
jgi:hypothetical protein